MRFQVSLLAAVAAFALVACGGSEESFSKATADDAPAQSQAQATAPSTDPQQQMNIATEQGREQLRDNMRSLLTEVQGQFADTGRADPGLEDQFPLIRLAESPSEWRVNLNPGVNYVFLGVCDADCTNVDLELIDGSGSAVASDLLDDDYPVMRYTPTAAGAYTVRAHLRVCSNEPCMMGVRALVE